MINPDPPAGPKNFTKQEFATGSHIFNEGDTGDMAYVIQSGSVEIFKGLLVDKVSLGKRSRGAVIGEMALFGDSARVATAVALEKTVVVGISRDAFRKRLDSMDPSMRAIMESLVDRVSDLSTRMVMTKNQDVWNKRP